MTIDTAPRKYPNINKWKNLKGLSWGNLEDETEIPQRILKAICDGRYEAQGWHLRKIAHALGVDSNVLL